MKGIREKMVASMQPYLEPGESIQAVISAQTMSPYVMVLARPLLRRNQQRVIAVTDRRIVVCRSGKVATSKVSEVLAVLPRQTRIGPPRGLWWKCRSLGDKVHIHRRFHADINRADAVLGPI